MKKSLIIAFIFTISALISIPFALLKVNAGKNKITITEEVLRGDPAIAAGITLRVRSHWNRHLLWETEYIVGSKESSQSKFTFSEKEVSWGRDGIVTAGISFPTKNHFYGNTDKLDLDFDEIPFSKIVRAAAEKIDNGSSQYSETVQIKDFYTYYPILFKITGQSAHYLREHNEEREYLTKYFHILTGEDRLNITVKKDEKNEIFSFEGEIISEKGKFSITDTQTIGKNGIYYIYCLTDTETMEGVDRGQNTGIFYFPFEEEQDFWKIDCTEVEKLCEFPYDFTPLEIMIDQEQETLLVAARKGEDYRFFVYQQTGKELILKQELPIGQKEEFLFDKNAGLSESFSKGEAEYPNEKEKDIMIPQLCEMIQKDNNILITWNNGWFSFLTQEENKYQIWCEAKFPDIGAEKENKEIPFSWEHTCIFDGERLVLAAFENWYSLNIVLAAYQKEKEVYVGLYRHSAEDITAKKDIKGKMEPQGARVSKPHSEWYWDRTGKLVEPLEIMVK